MRRNLASSLQDQMRQTAERQAYDPCTLDTSWTRTTAPGLRSQCLALSAQES